MVAKGLFVSGSTANNTRYAWRYAAAFALAATPPFNLTSSPFRVTSLVLQSVADVSAPDDLYHTAISNAIGGARRGTLPLFVGSVIPRGSDVYCSQIALNATWVADAVAASAAAARAFIDEYGSAAIAGWYVTQEAFLNHLGEGCHATAYARHLDAAAVASGYARFLGQWTRSLDALAPGLPFIWSPSAPESPRRGLNTSADYARTLAESLRTVSAAAPLLTNITIQDSVGKASNVSLAQRTIRYGVGCDDAVWHANITRSALSARVDVSINMESFLRAGQRPLHIVDLPADPRETELREACYARQGMRLGPSWEAGYWYRQLTEEWAL